MKLKELHENESTPKLDAEGFLTERDDIERWVKENLQLESYQFGIVSATNGVRLLARDLAGSIIDENTDLLGQDHIPIRIETSHSDISFVNAKVKNLKGLPEVLHSLSLEACNMLETLEGAPKELYQLSILTCKGNLSLEGISDFISNKTFNRCEINNSTIISGGIGLIFLYTIDEPFPNEFHSADPAFKIIQKYLGQYDRIFECQNELIDAGYESYAQL